MFQEYPDTQFASVDTGLFTTVHTLIRGLARSREAILVFLPGFSSLNDLYENLLLMLGNDVIESEDAG